MRIVFHKRLLALLALLTTAAHSFVFTSSGAPGAFAEIGAGGHTEWDSAAIAILNEDDFLSMDSQGSYYLGRDIDLCSTYPLSGVFTGKLDGRGHKITIVGRPIFAEFAGTIQNVQIEGAVGARENLYPKNAGAVAETASEGARFFNIYSDVFVFAAADAGGLVGRLTGDLSSALFKDCTAAKEILSDTGYAGGMVGNCDGGTVEFNSCSFSGTVSGRDGAGGICGYAKNATVLVASCANLGSVKSGEHSGGIVGGAESVFMYIKDSFNGSKTGGPAGESGSTQPGCTFEAGILAYQSKGYCFIADCKNYAGMSAGADYSGGIAAKVSAAIHISGCLNYGDIRGECAAGIVALAEPSTKGELTRRVEYCTNYGDITGFGAKEGPAAACGTSGGIVGEIDGGDGSSLYGNINNGNVCSYTGVSGGICALAKKIPLSVAFNCNTGEVNSSSGWAAQIISSGYLLAELTGNFHIAGGPRPAAQMNESGELVSLETGFVFEPSELANGRLASRLNSRASGGGGERDDRAGDMAACYGVLFQKLGADDRPSTDRSRGAVYYTNNGLTNTAEAGFSPDLLAGCRDEYIAAAEIISSLANFTGRLILTADIDLSATPVTIPGFSGRLEGNGHTITVAAPLFGQLSGEVCNLKIRGRVERADEFDGVGALAASAFGFTDINGVICEADVSAGDFAAGGLVGTAGVGYICFNNCSFGGSVVSSAAAGGIVGMCGASATRLSDCENTADVSGKNAAGLLGTLDSASYSQISRCYNRGKISAASSAGGIAGDCSGRLELYLCGNYEDISTAGSVAGGVAGYARKGSNVKAAFCFNTGGVGAKTYASGILGYCCTNMVSLSGCYVCSEKITGSPGNGCAIIYNKANENNGISSNFYLQGCAVNVCLQSSEETGENHSFTATDLKSGRLAFLLNKRAGREVFFQTLGDGADAYPTTDDSRGSVFAVSETAEGRIGFGNSEIAPSMLAGASVRLAEHPGIRFTARISAAAAAEISLLSDGGAEPEFGTLIFPTDYIDRYGISDISISGFTAAHIDEYNFASPEANNNQMGCYYINLRAKNGVVPDAGGGVYINAALVDLAPSAFNSSFSAVSYITYVTGGERYYVYSNYDRGENSRSIAYVAGRALADTRPYFDADDGYIYILADGTYSKYTQREREFLRGYLQN